MSYDPFQIFMEDYITRALVPVTYSGAINALPGENLEDPDPTFPTHSDDGEIKITFDMSGVTQPYGRLGVGIGNHNLELGDEVHLLFDTTNDFSSPALDIELDLSEFVDDTDYTSVTALMNKLFFFPADGEDETFSFDWMQLVITKASGSLRVGVVSIGRVNSEEDFTHVFTESGRSAELQIEASDSSMITQQGKVLETLDITFQNVDLDMLALIRRWMEEGGFQRERWLTFSSIGSLFSRHIYYGRIVSMSPIIENFRDPARGLYTFSITFQDLCPTPRKLDQETYTDHAEFSRLQNRSDAMLGIWMPGKIITDWAPGDSGTFTIESPYLQIGQVYVDGVRYTREDSEADCESNETTWFYDVEDSSTILLHITDDGDPADHIVEIRPVFGYCNKVPVKLKWLIMDIEIDGFTIPNICFRPQLDNSGIQSVTSELPSPYYGVSTPNVGGIRIFNGKRIYSDTHGRLDTYLDDLIVKQRPFLIYHGDGGVVLQFSEHVFIDKFQVISAGCNDEALWLQFDSQAVLQKGIPQDIFANDSAFREDYKPWYRGHVSGMPTFLQTQKIFGFAGNPTDDVEAVRKRDDEVNFAEWDLISEVDESDIEFDDAPSNDDAPFITVDARYCVDIDGVGGADTQLAGAFTRDMLRTLGPCEEDEIPATSFQDLDDDYNIRARGYIAGGDGIQTNLFTQLDKAARSFFSWIRHKEGIWEIYRFNPSSLRASVATIQGGDIIGTPEKVIDQKAPFRRARVAYFADPTLQESKFVTGDIANNRINYPISEIFDLKETFLHEEFDAVGVRQLIITTESIPQEFVNMQATGEVYRAWAGDVITVNRPKGFDALGEWESKKFIIKSITKHFNDSPGPGICDLVLVEPAPPLDAGGSVSYIVAANHDEVSDGTGAEVLEVEKTINNTGDTIVICVDYIEEVDTTPDVITWNGDACTLVGITPTATGIRSAMYRLFGADAGEHTGYVHFDNPVFKAIITVISLNGATAVRDSDNDSQASGSKTIQLTIISDPDDIVISLYGCETGPPIEQHSITPTNQFSHCAARTSYNGSFTNIKAMADHGSHGRGAASITVKHSESISTAAKTLIVASFQA